MDASNRQSDKKIRTQISLINYEVFKIHKEVLIVKKRALKAKHNSKWPVM